MVLRFRAQPVEKLGRGGALVGFHPGGFAQSDQGVGFFRAAGDNAARAVVFERPSYEGLAVGQQGRGEGIALITCEVLAVEGELQGFGAVDQVTAAGEAGAHGIFAFLRGGSTASPPAPLPREGGGAARQPGRLASIFSRTSAGGAVVWAL